MYDDSNIISGTFEVEEDYEDDVYNGESGYYVFVVINGDSYQCDVKDDDYQDNLYFYGELPEYYKVGTEYTIQVQDIATGEVFSKSYTVKHSKDKPELSFDKINCHTTKVKGTTEPGAVVQLKLGSKKYKVRADEEGAFTIKIPYTKINTYYKFSVVNELSGNKNEKKGKVANTAVKINVKSWLTVKTRKIKGTVSGAVKGDKIVVKISGKKYKGKIYGKNKKFVISIPKQKVGAKVTVVLRNKFNQDMGKYQDKIYLKNGIDKGMTRKQMRSTTWGAPDKVNVYDSGNYEQWIYYNDDDTLYVYFYYGKLISWERISN
ncbi:hypothetical protein lbkm_2744 [Lachnospiraceae bacterium KM106-2]|nr:hypothetical protein lbkm_2744 [Lachnospiraceae bacterium KM106-2]